MPEEVIFETEETTSSNAVADYLRTVAARLDAGDPITLRADGQEVTVTPPGRVEFEVKAERETDPGQASTSTSVEFEIEWDDAGGSEDGDGFAIE